MDGQYHQKGHIEVLAGNTDLVPSVNISSDGKRIASGSDDMSVRVWEHDGSRWHSEVLMRHTDRVLSVNMSSYGKRVVSGSWVGPVWVWEHD